MNVADKNESVYERTILFNERKCLLLNAGKTDFFKFDLQSIEAQGARVSFATGIALKNYGCIVTAKHVIHNIKYLRIVFVGDNNKIVVTKPTKIIFHEEYDLGH